MYTHVYVRTPRLRAGAGAARRLDGGGLPHTTLSMISVVLIIILISMKIIIIIIILLCLINIFPVMFALSANMTNRSRAAFTNSAHE